MCLKILFLLLISIVICILKSASCMKNKTYKSDPTIFIESRIVGGYRPHDFSLAKYIVSVRSQEESRSSFGYTHFCAGSIIGKRKILTAAHCVYRNLFPDIKVVAKTAKRLSISAKTQEINVKDIIIHPRYVEYVVDNDIALLILEKDISLDGILADIVSLPKADINPGDLCSVAGWGLLYMNGPLANEILHTNLNIITREQCEEKYGNLNSMKFCAFNIFDSGKDACLGDSGGPLICGDVITGIVSYGYGCAWGVAGVYTNVFRYIDWIMSNNGDNFLKASVFTVAITSILSAAIK